MPGKTRKEIVAVGMSGGVDSTMTAYLLKEQGYEIFGISMKIWPGDSVAKTTVRSGCYGPDEAGDITSAQSSCQRMGIPHYTVDLTREFDSRVLKNYLGEYQAGRTPNPCVLCNQFIKFGTLLEKARESGIDFERFATGHYARITQDPGSSRHELRKGTDRQKDQSYFLYRLNQEQLSQTLFPLGEMYKKDVVALARENGFDQVAAKPESQDFVDAGLAGEIFGNGSAEPGSILDLQGKVLGTHPGVSHFTIGQRKGLHLGGSRVPLYVVDIRPHQREIVVGPKEALAAVRLKAGFLNWIAIERLEQPLRAKARLRSRHTEADCIVQPMEGGDVLVEFEHPQYAAAPGQSVVFYQEDMMLGGGIILKVDKN
jgi:tRNA-specific 2-thiouridylase